MCDLQQRLQRTKDQVEEIQACSRSWCCPLLERREGRRDALLALEERADRLERCHAHIHSCGDKMHLDRKSTRLNSSH